MNDNLLKVTKKWMELERKTLEQRKEAELFYEKYLIKLIEEDFIERNQEKIYEEVEYFVVSVGTSFEPIVLNLKLFKPKKILFLCTEKTEDTLGRIVSYCDLEPRMYEKSKVSETDPLDIYREIKRYYLQWKCPRKMYIDFTGGTKAMSAAMAMAGALIDVQLVYVGSNDYLADFRIPNPGSETLFYINNPLTIFGDLEIEKALVLFERYNYAGAQDRLSELKEDIPDPNIRQQLNFVYLLAKTYEAWDALDFVPAYNTMVCLNKELKRDKMIHPTFLLMDCCDHLEKQEKVLEHLKNIPGMIKARNNFQILKSKDLITALMFTMYQNGITRELQEKYDMATLLFYRLLEMIEQRRLAHYNLNVSRMDYENIKYNLKNMPEVGEHPKEERFGVLKEKVFKIKQELFGKNVSSYLPEQVSLLEGFILLYALGDSIMTGVDKDGMNQLKRIRAMVFLRNNSIFAHGLGPVGLEDYFRFKNFVTEIFQQFCRIERVGYTEYHKNMQWINPLETKYYALGIGGE